MTGAYTYRLRLTSEQGQVQAEVRDPRGKLLGEPSGQLRYTEPYRSLVESSSQKALQGKGDKYILSKAEIEALGEALFRILFDDALQIDFLNTYNEIAHHPERRLLRVELDVDQQQLPQLDALPWEFLRVPPNKITGTLWLATAPRLIFSRRRARWRSPSPVQLQPGDKLRIALAVAAPRDENLGPVAYEKLWQELQDMVNANPEHFELLDLVEQATGDQLDALLAQKPHILHFVGHGRLADNNGSAIGQIAVVNDAGYAEWVDGSEFANLLNRHRPAIVLLQACEGAASDTSRAYANAASYLVDQNIPVVVAMQYEISNASARRFARRFYQEVAAGKPVDEAAQEGRYYIADWHKSRDFATPVLYMRVAQGQLFARDTQTRGEESAPETQANKVSEAGATTATEEKEPIFNRIRSALLECGPFRSNDAVTDLFYLDKRLAPWRFNVPQASNPTGRVNAVMAYLRDRWNVEHENALVLLLSALSEQNAGDVCEGRLAALAHELSEELQPPSW
jgi:hypothetical protein